MSIGLALQYLLDLAWDVDIHLGSRYDVYVDHECKNCFDRSLIHVTQYMLAKIVDTTATIPCSGCLSRTAYGSFGSTDHVLA
ncbi:hypothetical protein IG631_09322 [Alternaria alternata]|nr:hypothetical protein IG631_09322 [Alternaria alternata]